MRVQRCIVSSAEDSTRAIAPAAFIVPRWFKIWQFRSEQNCGQRPVLQHQEVHQKHVACTHIWFKQRAITVRGEHVEFSDLGKQPALPRLLRCIRKVIPVVAVGDDDDRRNVESLEWCGVMNIVVIKKHVRLHCYGHTASRESQDGGHNGVSRLGSEGLRGLSKGE
ncbi:hypothetical protein BT96DRAFT_979363 [Gymnopus androsaceus JB14]|uniref:Uncharacterized protein n=1 Tax=Gymnopus androsaceus JB14 TaxID=1447944 RepID=A0A6A4H2N3_9AGAR|nr:hypothetical protein BT96DRAFT_979363 [Gymnopus androsaceus JB14]